MIIRHQRDVGECVVLAQARGSEIDDLFEALGQHKLCGFRQVVIILLFYMMEDIGIFLLEDLWKGVAVTDNGIGHDPIMDGCHSCKVTTAEIVVLLQDCQWYLVGWIFAIGKNDG